MPLCSVEEALDDLKAGKLLVVVDDEQRENEGDLVMPAEMVTPEAVNFLISEARGLLCMPIIGERLDELNIPLANRDEAAINPAIENVCCRVPDLSPAALTCTDPGAVGDAPSLIFYQARAACPDGVEGTAHPY